MVTSVEILRGVKVRAFDSIGLGKESVLSLRGSQRTLQFLSDESHKPARKEFGTLLHRNHLHEICVAYFKEFNEGTPRQAPRGTGTEHTEHGHIGEGPPLQNLLEEVIDGLHMRCEDICPDSGTVLKSLRVQNEEADIPTAELDIQPRNSGLVRAGIQDEIHAMIEIGGLRGLKWDDEEFVED